MQQQTINKKTDLLIVGNYTHDTLIDDKQSSFQRLGGGAAYACAVAIAMAFRYNYNLSWLIEQAVTC